jgi:diaminopimelate epimerase
MAHFRKMHGLGNDFAVFDARTTPLALNAETAGAIANRRRGIGCDQVIVIERDAKGADAFMRIYNADGSEVESCGNASRCVAKLLLEETGKSEIRINSNGGLMQCRAQGDLVTIDMGEPRLDWREIPMAQAVETVSFALPLEVAGAAALGKASAVMTGNPHCVFFVSDVAEVPVEQIGPAVEHHAWFPARTNVEFVEPRSQESLRMRVWERGVGVTQACGTGACAAVVAAYRRGLTGREVTVELDGGRLEIVWRESDNHILMTGSATLSFEGEVDLAALKAGA